MLSPICNTHMSLFKDQGAMQKRGHKKWREKTGRCAANRPPSSEHGAGVALLNSPQLWLSPDDLHRTESIHIKDGGRGLVGALLEASGIFSVQIVKYTWFDLSYQKCIYLVLKKVIKAFPLESFDQKWGQSWFLNCLFSESYVFCLSSEPDSVPV